MESVNLAPRTLVGLIAIALVSGSTLTATALRFWGTPGPRAAAAGMAMTADDESLRVHRELLAATRTLETRNRAMCLMLGDYVKAAPAVMELCR